VPSPTQFVTLLAAARARKREQWLPPLQLKELRGSRLRRLARAAAMTAHYGRVFREAGLEPEQLADERELARLPILEKATLHAATENGMVAEPVEGLSSVTTSGSTGQPLRVFRNVWDQAHVSALWARVLHAFGQSFFDSRVNIGTGRAVARTGPVALLRRLGVLPQIRHISSFEPVSRQVEILRERHPHTFSSYAISLEMIADALLDQGIRDIRPKVVFSAAMPLSDRGRAAVKEAFGVAPLEVYVAAELGTIGWECPEERGALHLNDDMQIVEILDDRDRPVPDGETGQVVVT
jgi:phenylacetate-CoA ligase